MLIFAFFLVTKSKFPDSKISEISDSQFVNLCENSTQNICIFKNFQENSSYQIKADGNNTLYVVSENTQSNRITRIVQLDTYGNIIFQSLVNTILEIESELNVYGHLDISRYHLFTKNIILHEDAVLIAGIIEAQSITYKCGTGFSCPSISAKFIQATNDNLNIAFDEPNEEDKKNPPLNNESIILTAYSYRCPSVNFDLLNNSREFGSVFLTCNTETITSTNRNNLNTFSASNSLGTISYYTARFIGCRSPRYISNGECNLCPGTNSAAITDGSFTCQTCEAGSEYISSTRECKLCEPGTYYDNETKTCRACPIGSYQNDYGKLNCIKCPENSTTILTGQSTLKSCVCPAGYHGHYGEICVECDEFEDCPFGSISSNAEPGYWQDINKLITPLQCLPSYACLGNNICSKEYEGKFCGSCANGYFRLHQGCFKCHTSLPVILGILMLVYVIFIFYVTIYHESLLSVLIITFVFLQEVSLFAFFNTTEKFSSAEFVSYLSFFYLNPQLFQLQCFGYHSFSSTFQVAVIMPIIIAFVLFICSLISWKLPFLIRRIMKRNKEMNEIFTMKDCLRVFYEVFITTFYIIFPSYFGLIMRMFKSSNIDGGSYFDYQPSFYYDTKVITESRISYGVVFGLFILLTVALDSYLAIFQLQKTVVTYKVVNWFQKKPISLRSGHPFINIFNKKLYFWVIIVHTRLFIVFCFWSYMQRSSSLQTALLITIYLISTAIQMGFKPFLRETDNYICFLSKFLLLLNSLMTAGELGWLNSSNTINSMLIASITLYFMGLLLTTLLPPIIRRFRESDEIGGKDTKTETSVTFNIDNLLNQLSSANEGYKIIKAIIDIPSNPNLSFRQKILLKAMFEEIYDDLMKYAENSHQDFLDVKKFIDDARTLLLRIVTVVLKKQNMIDSLWLNEVGVEWEQMKQKIENKKKSLEEENEESSNQMSSFFDEDF